MNIPRRGCLMRTGLLLVVSVFYIGCSDPSAESCAKIESIASDPEKIAYLKSWIEERMSQEEFLRHMGSLGRVNAIDDRAHFLELGLDLDLLGIDASHGFVRLHGKANTGAAYMQKSNITSFSIGEGRSGVLILLDDEDVMGRLEAGGDHDGLRSFADDIFVFCR